MAYVGLYITSFYLINLFVYKRRERPTTTKKFPVTICIPAYNEEKSIGPTIESALALDYPKDKLEIIVVDDGSTDKTYEVAKKYASSRVHVFRQKNGGKGSALNLGISKAKGEIFVSMDADTFAEPDALSKLVARFHNERVAAVTPTMLVHKPKGLWPRVQQIEYYLGVFLRKSFAIANAIHITAGAFSAYRLSFFKKYGGYEVGNITEDMEIALRMQLHNYVLDNEPTANVYTLVPTTFRGLVVQRRRWYTGLITNLWGYRSLFGFKRGALGTVVLPAAIFSVIGGIILTTYVVIRSLRNAQRELQLLDSINFQFSGLLEFNTYMFEHLFFSIFTNPVAMITFVTVAVMSMYLLFGKRHVAHKERLRYNFVLFIMSYSVLFFVWWVISLFYIVTRREVGWRSQKHGKD